MVQNQFSRYLDSEYDKNMDVLRKSKYLYKINFLLTNPILAYKPLSFKDKRIKSCCAGTVVYIIDKNKEIKELWKNRGYKIDVINTRREDIICIPDNNSPGFIGRKPMEAFLDSFIDYSEIPKKDSIVAYFGIDYNNFNPRFGYLHGGIYLGKREDREEIVFQQKGIGLAFEFEKRKDLLEGFSGKKSIGDLIELFYDTDTL
jgi:hypothetical protein